MILVLTNAPPRAGRVPKAAAGTLPPVSRTATCVWRVEPTLVLSLDEHLGPPVDSYVNGTQTWLSDDGPGGMTLEWRLHPVAGYRPPAGLSHYDLWEQVVDALSAGVDPDALDARLRAAHAALALGRARVLRGVRRGDRTGAARAGRDRGARATARRVGSRRPRPHRHGLGAGEGHGVDRRDGVRGAPDPRRSRHDRMSTVDREGLAREIYDRTHLTGEFVLRSGAVSNEYFDKYLFESDPVLLRNVGEALVPLVPDGHRGARRASSSAGSRSPRCCRSSPASPRCSCARRRRPTAPAGSPRAARSTDARLTVVEDVVTSGGQVIMSSERPPRARRDRRARGERHRPPRSAGPSAPSPTPASSCMPSSRWTELKQPASADRSRTAA